MGVLGEVRSSREVVWHDVDFEALQLWGPLPRNSKIYRGVENGRQGYRDRDQAL